MCLRSSKDEPSEGPAVGPRPAQAPGRPQPSSAAKPSSGAGGGTSGYSNSNNNMDFAPPPGPPPKRQQQQQQQQASPGDDDVAPPPGPPPSYRAGGAGPPSDDYAPPPPPGPPPAPAQQHDWASAVPDTALFPPPPDLFSGWDRSPATNAPEAEAEAGERWCAQHPLAAPSTSAPAARPRDPALLAPYPPAGRFAGTLARAAAAPGVWRVATPRGSRDSCVVASPPLYAAAAHSPLATGRAWTAYYEVRVAAVSPPPGGGRGGGGGDDGCLAVGYAALPYPSFRMPGWHRGSVAVHGDDGHRYVNDRWGGRDFVRPFGPGETVGLGVRMAPAAAPAGGDGTGRRPGGIDVEVFFTRGGREEGRWNLHEETDAEQDLPVTGLEGYHDLACAVGTFGECAFEVVFDPAQWAYKGVVD